MHQIKTHYQKQDQDLSLNLAAPDNITAFELAIIKLAQNYRQRGFDTTLLQAMHLCVKAGITRYYLMTACNCAAQGNGVM